MYPVAITSQGQMSLPVYLLKKYNLKKPGRIVLHDTDDGLLIKPVKDLLDFAGTFKTNKKASSRQVREAFGDYLAHKAAGKTYK